MILAAIVTAAMTSAAAQPSGDVNTPTRMQVDRSARWTVTWAASPQLGAGAGGDLPELITNQTIRQVVHISAGGMRVRVRLSNEFGTSPLVIGKATVAVSRDGSHIDPLTLRTLTVEGASLLTIPPGAASVSDPVNLDVKPLTDLAISLYLPRRTTIETVHLAGFQTGYLGERGDQTTNRAISNGSTFSERLFLTAVEVDPARPTSAIVAFGDSITDGGGSTPDANRRGQIFWPNAS